MNNTNNQQFLGEGSYGCAWKPGISCNYKINTTNTVNKIQKINFYSLNELLISDKIKKIKKYTTRFSAIQNYCKVKFEKILHSSININKCENLFKKYIQQKSSNNQLLEDEYYMFYINYIHGDELGLFFNTIKDTPYLYYKYYLYSIYYLLNSIQILIDNNIMHNDLHSSNIIYNYKKNRPIIIDFGLSTYNTKFYIKKKLNTYLNYDYLHNLFFNYTNDSINHLHEKRFISFIINNDNINYYKYINDDNIINDLNENIINLFINDIIDSINNYELKFIFTNNEILTYKNYLQKFYYKFIDKKNYPYISTIVKELLPYVFKYNDLYMISFTYINNYYRRFYNNLTQENPLKSEYIFIFYLLSQLFKKVFYPDPDNRIQTYQFIKIIQYIINYINTFDTNLLSQNNNDYYTDFYNNFYIFLDSININTNHFFDKNYAYIDFNNVINKKNILLFKKLDIKL